MGSTKNRNRSIGGGQEESSTRVIDWCF